MTDRPSTVVESPRRKLERERLVRGKLQAELKATLLLAAMDNLIAARERNSTLSDLEDKWLAAKDAVATVKGIA